jgi:hypothetical protein
LSCYDPPAGGGFPDNGCEIKGYDDFDCGNCGVACQGPSSATGAGAGTADVGTTLGGLHCMLDATKVGYSVCGCQASTDCGDGVSTCGSTGVCQCGSLVLNSCVPGEVCTPGGLSCSCNNGTACAPQSGTKIVCCPGTGCKDLTVDANNCGACGRKCYGNCVASECQ